MNTIQTQSSKEEIKLQKISNILIDMNSFLYDFNNLLNVMTNSPVLQLDHSLCHQINIFVNNIPLHDSITSLNNIITDELSDIRSDINRERILKINDFLLSDIMDRLDKLEEKNI